MAGAVALFRAGQDNVLMPHETVGGFLLFLKTASGPIGYTPRVLGGIPPR